MTRNGLLRFPQHWGSAVSDRKLQLLSSISETKTAKREERGALHPITAEL